MALWCWRLSGDREAAADLAQEVFLKAFRSLDSFRGESKFSTWLYTIARNHCFNELKSRATRPVAGGEELALEVVDEGVDALAGLEKEESVRMLRRLLKENLTETEARVMVLHYGEELPLDSVGRLLRLENASGAKAYIVSAKRKLAKVIGRWREGESRSKSK